MALPDGKEKIILSQSEAKEIANYLNTKTESRHAAAFLNELVKQSEKKRQKKLDNCDRCDNI